ncbi:hypothetical protein TNCV_4823291 [Trichonephila clavipes]|nr:hypothetical protein TNCV_4823291 [Trichonephila clavipes]
MEKGIRTAADSVQSGWPVVASGKSNGSREKPRNLRAQAQLSETKTETCELLVKRERRKTGGARSGVTVIASCKPIC